MQTVDERVKKLRENQKKTPFSWGYLWGVQTYRRYPKVDRAERKRLSEQIDGYKAEARDGKGGSRECAIGFLCGMRDSAIERKSRQGK